MSELFQMVYVNNEIRIIKQDDGYLVQTNINNVETERDMTISELSILSRQLSLMVYEFHNPDHYDIKPCGFRPSTSNGAMQNKV